MDTLILEHIAQSLDGTDDSLAKLLTKMGITEDPFDVEAKLERQLSFGYCQECMLWCDDVIGGLCSLCLEDST